MIRSKRVIEIFSECLLREEDLVGENNVVKAIYSKGLRGNVPFHPEKINCYKEEIKEMLKSLPIDFKKNWGFLDLCHPVEDGLWSNIHEVCEKILLLGIAIGDINCLFPYKDPMPMPKGGKIAKNPIAMISKDFESRGTIGMNESWVVAKNLKIKFIPKIEKIDMFFENF